jgi:hypothetical protein
MLKIMSGLKVITKYKPMQKPSIVLEILCTKEIFIR